MLTHWLEHLVRVDRVEGPVGRVALALYRIWTGSAKPASATLGPLGSMARDRHADRPHAVMLDRVQGPPQPEPTSSDRIPSI
jgi:hypothetical protein